MTKYGLRAQVITYTILPTILIGGLLATYFTINRYMQGNDFLINRAINITEPLAIASEYGIQDETRTILRRIIGATHRKNSAMIKSIAIFDAENKLFVTSNYHRNFQLLKIEQGQSIPEITQVIHHLDSTVIQTPIIDESNFLEYQLTFDQPRKVIGYVSLEINRSQVDLLFFRDAALSLIVVLMGIIGSLFFAFRQAKRITGPITEMASVVEKISLGRLNARVEGSYSGEIESLKDGINQMGFAMSKHHEEMQDNIDQATSELRETLDLMEVQNIELDITRKDAQQAASVKSEFLANMSHELRTPLNGVIGFARQLLKTQMTTNQVDYLQTIERSAGNLLNIINDILDFSKLEAGKLTLEHIPFDLRECIDETMHLLAPSAHEKKLELSMMVDSEVPSDVLGDAMRLQQILTNLIGNAIKFTQEGNIEVQIQRIRQEDDVDNNVTLKIMISDTGIGISEKQQQQLFKAFGQADSSVTRQYGGTGLGLVITQKLVTEMQGSIDLVSAPNQGSTFWFTITIEKNSHSPLEQLPLDQLQKQSILVYETNEFAARACSQLLNQWRTTLTLAETELQLQRSLDKQYSSIVIGYSHCDNLQPLLSHIEKAKSFTKNIVVLINSSDPSIFEMIQKMGVNHCLSKPINHKHLANVLVPENESSPELIAPQNIPALVRKDINVMAVDDNPANLKLIQAMLNDRVNHVTTCVNGQLAVDQSQLQKFDLIFMDIQMPILDGISACLKIKDGNTNNETPIIAVTAHVLPGEKEQFLQQGMDDCLAKPIDEHALQQIINKWTPDAKLLESVAQNSPDSLPPTSNHNVSFDWQLALKQSAGKEDLAKEMLTMLLADFPEIAECANKAINNEIDNVHLTQVIHKFHGGCSYSGVPKLKKIAAVIEQELKQGISPDLLEPELLELLDELENVQRAASEYL
ncbi:two-component sensor histidine kinase BarA [Psychromonas sp. psych-6C06]|uniref:two-component sensor histidine kinase BarA n=1 Tax=Psychromonas sp. psych-6C06 TaxID=2058089 RepID=UPI000C320E5A|nr:two-component sensor histidine kinase BarA [Psychromonas sp. psych-6C06]PKF61176.1 two-component sensor histidine kinase BarA [Psychromonas sp. psych-6C06]